MIPRHLRRLLEDSLSAFPAVLLVGARQVGKSTLAAALAGPDWPARYLTLDDRTVLDAAAADPDGLLRATATPAIIDEVQRTPDVLRAIKLVIDQRRTPGMFLLTGSANVLTLATVSETLAGRLAVHELAPFSWAELAEQPVPATIDRLFAASDARALVKGWPSRVPEARGAELRDLILHGGYPTPALMRSPRARRTWFESYRQTYLDRDLRDLANIEHRPDFGRLLTTLALRTGTILNHAELSRDVGLPVATIRRYFNLLGQTFQLHVVPPYAANVGKRLVKTPKVYLTDTGLCCHLVAAYSWDALARGERAGAMVETWAAAELRKLIALAGEHTDLWYYRTHGGDEVDFVLERGGELVGVEVKLAAGLDRRHLGGLVAARAALGRRWRLGVVVHGGAETLAIDERTAAVPFSVFFGRDQ
ncbi:MAG TPA: ATP-binding protein [Polyangia bacterium]